MAKYYIYTFGCKVNQADSQELAASLMAEGNEIAKEPASADVCIVNTCTVTASADAQCRQMARRLRAKNANAKIIMTGCYVNVSKEELKNMPEVDEMRLFGDLASCFMPHASAERSMKHEAGGMITSRARPHLKIQDGCDNFCAYCIVPYARGRSRSVHLNEVLERIDNLKLSGVHEVVLTGIHLGGYGKDLRPKTKLAELLKDVVSRWSLVVSKGVANGQRPTANDDFRIRLSSIDPDEWTDELINFIAENSFICRHFHIPLQSGSDEILRKMGRRYDTKYYSSLIFKLKDKMLDSAVGADVIAGFPGETEELFQRTVEFIKGLPLSYLHVFPYSKRPFTEAGKLKEAATNAEKERRVKILREISAIKRERFYAGFVGKNLDVVVENKRDKRTGKLKGISSNYVPVIFDGDDGLFKKITRVMVIDSQIQMSYGRAK